MDFKDLPTNWILLDMDLKPIVKNGSIMFAGRDNPDGLDTWYQAKCHRDHNGFITKPIEKVAELVKMRRDPDPDYANYSIVCRPHGHFKYGVEIPQENEK